MVSDIWYVDGLQKRHILLPSSCINLFVTSPDEYRILVDMRWNKQYLDILANKCNFEDEERYMEFLEALNAVANRYAAGFLLT